MSNTSEYKIGMIVRHPTRSQWGPGKILDVASDRTFRSTAGRWFER